MLHRCNSFFIYLKGESSRNLNSLPSLRQMLPALAASLAFAPPGGVARATAVHRSSAATMGFLDGVKASPPASLFSFCSDDTRRSVLFADNLAASVLSLPTRASGEAVCAVDSCAQTITSPPRLSTVFFTFSRLSYRESNTQPLAFPTNAVRVLRQDAFGSGGDKPLVTEDRVTPFDRWLGLDKDLVEGPQVDETASYIDPLDVSNYAAYDLAKPMGIAFVENEGECGGVFVEEVLESGSANGVGVAARDQLVAVDGTLVMGLEFDAALDAIKVTTTLPPREPPPF